MSDFLRTTLSAIVGFTLLGSIGCEPEPRAELPSDEVLIELIMDLHKAEATMNRINNERQDSVALIVRERIATSYGVSPETMDLWLENLQKSPEHMVVIYDSVIARYERQIAK